MFVITNKFPQSKIMTIVMVTLDEINKTQK
jgi:hypothetical protein